MGVGVDEEMVPGGESGGEREKKKMRGGRGLTFMRGYSSCAQGEAASEDIFSQDPESRPV